MGSKLLSPGLPGSLGLKQAGLWLAGIPSSAAESGWQDVSPRDRYDSASQPGRESGINGLFILTLWEILISTAYKHRKGKMKCDFNLQKRLWKMVASRSIDLLPCGAGRL